MPIAAVVLEFDPVLRLGDLVALRWQLVILTVIVLLALAAAGLLGRRAGLRPDDLLFIAVGAVPGAVAGGRLEYVLVHADAYAAAPDAILDPATGSLGLGLAVVGGALTAAIVANLLDAPVGRWARVVALPLLLAIGLGKLALLLGGSGQGTPTDAAWAVAFSGSGPWSSLAPALPAHPSQAYEGLATLALSAAFAIAMLVGHRHPRSWVGDGRLFVVAVGAWALVRVVVGTTWREAEVVGPLRAGQLIALVLVVGTAALLAAYRLMRRVDGTAARTTVPEWPEPSSRPRF